MIPLRRHALVWLSEIPETDLLEDASAVAQWQAENYPYVVCRQCSGSDRVALGFCLDLPGLRPRRIAVQARPDQISRIERPPALNVVAPMLQTGDSRSAFATFQPLIEAVTKSALDVRVFGSWMWQAITGRTMVTASSDLDLLIDAANRLEADRAVAFLQRETESGLLRLDGELSCAGDWEVPWREYLGDAPQVLVKSLEAVRMIPREELWK